MDTKSLTRGDMIAEEFTENLKRQIVDHAKEHIKNNIEPEIKKLHCNQCNSQTYSIEHFTDDENSIVAHLKCTDCGFEGNFVVHLEQDNLSNGLNDVKNSLHELQSTIQKINIKQKF
jgi:RNase P subunit RPR2